MCEILYQYVHLGLCHFQKLGVMADVASHNIVLKSCCLAAKVELAHDIYREMQRLELDGALKLDVFTYSTMIKVLFQLGLIGTVRGLGHALVNVLWFL